VNERGDAYYWRLFATACCFVVFGLGGLALGLVVFPLTRLLPGGELAQRGRVRRTLGAVLRWFADFTVFMGVLTYEVSGAQRLGRPGQLVLANHPSLIDVVFLLAFSPSSSCIGKQSLWANPFTRGPVSAAGYVSNDSVEGMIEGASAALTSGQSAHRRAEVECAPAAALYRGARRKRGGDRDGQRRRDAHRLGGMTLQQQTYEMIRGSLIELFQLEPGRITPEARLADDLEIDSIDAVDLVDHVRRLTGRKITAEDFRSVRTVGDLVHALERLVHT
jgi:acyl carrier protein